METMSLESPHRHQTHSHALTLRHLHVGWWLPNPPAPIRTAMVLLQKAATTTTARALQCR